MVVSVWGIFPKKKRKEETMTDVYKDTYYFEVTDTFSGDANYCWVERYKVEASCVEGAIGKLRRFLGYNFTQSHRDRWDDKHACVCAFDMTEVVYIAEYEGSDPDIAKQFRQI